MENSQLRKKIYFALVSSVLIIGLVAFVALENYYAIRATPLESPIAHEPPITGSYPFVLGSGNVFQNDSAYSYVRLNSTSLYPGVSFMTLPSLNVGISGVDLSNLTAIMTYTGSSFGANPYWINFSIALPELGVSMMTSHQLNFFARSNATILKNVDFFTQVSNVVGVGNEEFEFFFYMGSSSTPVPVLTHGPVN